MRWAKSLTSITCFMLGALFFSRLMRWLTPLRRSTVVLSFLLQAGLTYISAGLVQSAVIPPDAGSLLPEDCIVLVPLALLAVQSAGQIVLSRLLGYGEVTTLVLTSAYCDFIVDEHVFTAPLRAGVKRNRRVAAVVMLLCGAVAGGFLTRNGDIALALWVAGSIKLLIAVVWMFWKGKAAIRLD